MFLVFCLGLARNNHKKTNPVRKHNFSSVSKPNPPRAAETTRTSRRLPLDGRRPSLPQDQGRRGPRWLGLNAGRAVFQQGPDIDRCPPCAPEATTATAVVTAVTVVVTETAPHGLRCVCLRDPCDRHNPPARALASPAVLANLWGSELRTGLELMGFYLLVALPPPDTPRIFHWVFLVQAASSASKHQEGTPWVSPGGVQACWCRPSSSVPPRLHAVPGDHKP